MNPKFKVMMFDDERSCMKTISLLIAERFPDCELKEEDNPYQVFGTIALFRPDLIIMDFCFGSYEIYEEEDLMRRLFKFKGKVCIYSGHPKHYITKSLLSNYSRIPSNFRILSKDNPKALLKEIEMELGRV